jgi:Spy/CpxP family protein refolding chaperone
MYRNDQARGRRKMKRTIRLVMWTMVFGLISFLTLQVRAEQKGTPMETKGGTVSQGGEKGNVESQGVTPWAGRRHHWGRVPRTLMGKIYLWERYVMDHRDVLGLTDQQVDEIGSGLNSQRKYWISKRADRTVLIMEIEELLSKGPLDLSKVEEKVKSAQAISAGMVMEEIRTLEKVLSILTPDQRKAVEEFMKESTFTGVIRAY